MFASSNNLTLSTFNLETSTGWNSISYIFLLYVFKLPVSSFNSFVSKSYVAYTSNVDISFFGISLNVTSTLVELSVISAVFPAIVAYVPTILPFSLVNALSKSTKSNVNVDVPAA